MSNGRSTTGESAVPHYLGPPLAEAVKHLKLTAKRFLDQRATYEDLDEAMRLVRDARRAASKEQP